MGGLEDRGEPGRALAASEERYRLISEVISDYTFSTKLDSQGRLYLNWVAGAFERITGYTYEEYVARGGWLATLHPDDLEQDARDMEALRSNQPVVSEVRTVTKSGAVRWVRVYGHPVWDQERDQLVGIYGAVQDVTDRRKAEAEREELIRELEAKNAELERFTYTVSHDLKSPLITIRGFLTFVERDALEGNVERLKADVGRIADAVAKMQRLLNELLELSRIGRVVNPPRSTPFGSLAREAEALVAGRIAERHVEVSIEEELPWVWGDRDRLIEVVQNLLDNAVKFMGSLPRPDLHPRPRLTPAGGSSSCGTTASVSTPPFARRCSGSSRSWNRTARGPAWVSPSSSASSSCTGAGSGSSPGRRAVAPPSASPWPGRRRRWRAPRAASAVPWPSSSLSLPTGRRARRAWPRSRGGPSPRGSSRRACGPRRGGGARCAGTAGGTCGWRP